MSNSFIFSVVSCPLPELAFTNRVFVSYNDFNKFESNSPKCVDDPYLNVYFSTFNSKVYMMVPHDNMIDGTIALNQLQRSNCGFTLKKEVMVKLFDSDVILLDLHMEVEPMILKNDLSILDLDELSVDFHQLYKNQVFHENNKIAMKYNGLNLIITILFMTAQVSIMETIRNIPSCYGKILSTTNLTWQKKPSGPKGTTQEYICSTGPTGPIGHTGPTEN